MLMQHDRHTQLRVIMLHVEHTTLLTHTWSQGALGLIIPAVITPVLTRPVLLHPYERRAAMECIPVVVPVLVWSLPPLHFL